MGRRQVEDEEQVEKMINDCLEVLNKDDSFFNTWEQTFLESLEDLNDWYHLTDNQIKKLEQIYEKINGLN